MKKRRPYFHGIRGSSALDRRANRTSASGFGRRLAFESLEGRQMLAALLVTTASDGVSHSGMSLRDAIITANADARVNQADTIKFAASLNAQTITLAQGPLEMGLGGTGSGTITVNGS